jgi:ferredoxin
MNLSDAALAQHSSNYVYGFVAPVVVPQSAFTAWDGTSVHVGGGGEGRLAGEGCSKPEESCLAFGLEAEFYQRNGLGRLIEREEALAILTRADEAGLVLQPGNAQDPTFICCCCGCCCGALRNLKVYPKPATRVFSPFMAVASTEFCHACGTYTDRCQMGALRLEVDKVILDRDRCIGCGLCVSTCPTDSLALVRKAQLEQPKVPKNRIRASIELAQARGRLSSTHLSINDG